MMAVTDLVPTNEDDDGAELNQRQKDAFNKLEALGAKPRANPTDPYDTSPKVRALQLIYEGRLGGPNRGQGRRRTPRASELLAEKIRKKVKQMERVVDNGLESENDKVALDTLKTVIKIEHDEAALQVKEQQLDASLDGQSKEELIATLIELAGEATTQAAVEGYIDLPASEATEITEAEIIPDEPEEEPTHTFSGVPLTSVTRPTGFNFGSPERDGSRRSASNRSQVRNPFTQTARGRPTD